MTRRVCLLTGASGPLGNAFIDRYADRYEIAAIQHRAAGLLRDPGPAVRRSSATRSRARGRTGGKVYAIRADIGRQEEIERAVAAALAEFGSVDLLINAAAVRRFSPLLRADHELHAEEAFNVNVLAPLLALARARRAHAGSPTRRRTPAAIATC